MPSSYSKPMTWQQMGRIIKDKFGKNLPDKPISIPSDGKRMPTPKGTWIEIQKYGSAQYKYRTV